MATLAATLGTETACLHAADPLNTPYVAHQGIAISLCGEMLRWTPGEWGSGGSAFVSLVLV